MELHELVRLIRDEHLTAIKRSLEDDYWMGRYSVTKELLLKLDRERTIRTETMCIHCFEKTKSCEGCFR